MVQQAVSSFACQDPDRCPFPLQDHRIEVVWQADAGPTSVWVDEVALVWVVEVAEGMDGAAVGIEVDKVYVSWA